MNDLNPDTFIYRLEESLRRVDKLNAKCEENMRRLNEMMQELKGIIAMVRPAARKNDWYGEELHCDGTVVYGGDPINKSGKEYIDSKLTHYASQIKIEHQTKK